ncbi:MAG: oxidoreductase [Desulfobacca sp.]|nr:oxidoreductase [Desulfobacca sp.]
MFDLSEKVVIVTGASSGIGAALALAFSREGAKVTLAARRIERLQEVGTQCSGEKLIIQADLLQKEDRQAIIRKTFDRWGQIDILINNAGTGMYGHFQDTTDSDWRTMFEINLFSAVFLTQDVLPFMQARQEGLVVNIASIGGLMAHSNKVTPYVASKHALIGFSRGLAKDLIGTGIRVLAVCPHLTDTEFFSTCPGAEEMAPEVEKSRDFMDTPEKVAQGILEQLDSEQLVIFPTDKPARVYEKKRDI